MYMYVCVCVCVCECVSVCNMNITYENHHPILKITFLCKIRELEAQIVQKLPKRLNERWKGTVID